MELSLEQAKGICIGGNGREELPVKQEYNKKNADGKTPVLEAARKRLLEKLHMLSPEGIINLRLKSNAGAFLDVVEKLVLSQELKEIHETQQRDKETKRKSRSSGSTSPAGRHTATLKQTHRRSRSRSPQRARRSRSRSPWRGNRSRSRSPCRGNRSRSPSPLRGNWNRSRSPWRGNRSRTRSPCRINRSRSPCRINRSRSPCRINRSRSPYRMNRSRSPYRINRSRSPYRINRSRSPQRSYRSRSRSPWWRVRSRSKSPLTRYDRDTRRSPPRFRRERSRSRSRSFSPRQRYSPASSSRRSRSLSPRRRHVDRSPLRSSSKICPSSSYHSDHDVRSQPGHVEPLHLFSASDNSLPYGGEPPAYGGFAHGQNSHQLVQYPLPIYKQMPRQAASKAVANQLSLNTSQSNVKSIATGGENLMYQQHEKSDYLDFIQNDHRQDQQMKIAEKLATLLSATGNADVTDDTLSKIVEQTVAAAALGRNAT